MEKLALVTGATSGIGFAYSELLAKKGWDLVITGRRVEVINERAEYLKKKYKTQVDVAIVDFADTDSFSAFRKQYLENCRYTFLVNNVGFSNHCDFFATEFHKVHNMIEVHISRMAEIVHLLVPYMKMAGGTIVNVSSLAGYLPSLSDPFYAGSKAFINTYSESIAMILSFSGIKVQTLCPGFTRTDFHKDMKLDKKAFKNRGLKRWMTAKAVVRYSFRKLKSSRTVVIPGWTNRFVYHITRLIPKRTYYKMAMKKRVLDEE